MNYIPPKAKLSNISSSEMSSNSLIQCSFAPGILSAVRSSERKCLVPISCLTWPSCLRNSLKCSNTPPQSELEPGRSITIVVLALSVELGAGAGAGAGVGAGGVGAGQDSASPD